MSERRLNCVSGMHRVLQHRAVRYQDFVVMLGRRVSSRVSYWFLKAFLYLGKSDSVHLIVVPDLKAITVA